MTYGGSKDGVIWQLEAVETPEDGATGRLDTLVESSQVRSLSTRVAEGAHVPVKR